MQRKYASFSLLMRCLLQCKDDGETQTWREIINNNDNNNNNINNGIIIIIIKMARIPWVAELLYFAHENLHLDFKLGQLNVIHPISFC
jgi:hypothetical protein